MPGIGIIVDSSEFDQYMSTIGDPARLKSIERKALRKGATITRDAIAARAPVRPDLPSGTALPQGALANDIVLRAYTDSDGRECVSVQPGKLTDHVAGWVEFGHRLVQGGYSRMDRKTGKTRGPGKEAGQVPAHPFFRPGTEESVEAAVSAIQESLSADVVNEHATTDTEAA